MGYAQRFQFRQVVQMFLFAATPVNGDIAVRVTLQCGQQNRTHIGEACTTGNQDQRTVFIFTQPGVTVWNIYDNFTLFKNAIHNGHRIQIQL